MLRRNTNYPTRVGPIRVGTSGWNYPKGQETWNGIFYPTARGRPKGCDELTYYAEHFDTVEVNSTFYGQPKAEVSRSWADRTPAGFEFSVKLYQKFTHPNLFKERVSKTLKEAVADASVIEALSKPHASDLDEFR